MPQHGTAHPTRTRKQAAAGGVLLCTHTHLSPARNSTVSMSAPLLLSSSCCSAHVRLLNSGAGVLRHVSRVAGCAPAACQDEQLVRGLGVQPLDPLSHPTRVCQPAAIDTGKQHRLTVNCTTAAGFATGQCSWVRCCQTDSDQEAHKTATPACKPAPAGTTARMPAHRCSSVQEQLRCVPDTPVGNRLPVHRHTRGVL